MILTNIDKATCLHVLDQKALRYKNTWIHSYPCGYRIWLKNSTAVFLWDFGGCVCVQAVVRHGFISSPSTPTPSRCFQECLTFVQLCSSRLLGNEGRNFEIRGNVISTKWLYGASLLPTQGFQLCASQGTLQCLELRSDLAAFQLPYLMPWNHLNSYQEIWQHSVQLPCMDSQIHQITY